MFLNPVEMEGRSSQVHEKRKLRKIHLNMRESNELFKLFPLEVIS